MRRIPATEFITKVGTYMDAARSEPVAVTSHGREKVILLSPEEYRRLRDSAAQNTSTTEADSPWSRLTERLRSDPLTIALSVLNTSTPVKVDAADLQRLFQKNDPRYKAQARLLIEEVPERVLAGLVRDRVVSWDRLHRLAQWVDTKDHEKKAFIRDMAGIPVGRSGKTGRPRS